MPFQSKSQLVILYQQSDSKFYRERHKAPITSMIFKEKNKDRGLALFNFKTKKKKALMTWITKVASKSVKSSGS